MSSLSLSLSLPLSVSLVLCIRVGLRGARDDGVRALRFTCASGAQPKSKTLMATSTTPRQTLGFWRASEKLGPV